MKQMNNEIIYPRSEEEVLLILATAKKRRPSARDYF